MSYVIFPLAIIHSSIFKGVDAMAFLLAVFPLSIVSFSRYECVDTSTFFYSILPIAIVGFTIVVYKVTLTLSFIIDK